MDASSLPAEIDFAWPAIKALRELGGSGRIAQINEIIVEAEGITEQQLSICNPKGRPYVYYRIDWARSVLKRIGAMDNSIRGIWSLTQLGLSFTESDCRARYEQERQVIREENRRKRNSANKMPLGKAADVSSVTVSQDLSTYIDNDEVSDDLDDWKSELHERLVTMRPEAFERLSRRLLLEAGFQNVQVTGRPGDGGIDGVGVYRVSLVSFPVYFQCKRFSGTVQANMVRDFRGALAGRGEKGLLITTGEFTKGARDEAVRAGATPIDLVDGNELCELLKQYELGVKVTTRTVEDVEIVPAFFDQF